MKAFLFVLMAMAGLAHAEQTEYSPILRCEKYEGSMVTIVSIERKVVDLYTPRVRFVDRLVSEVRVIDPGSAAPWIGGKVSSSVDTKTGATTYAGRGFSLQITKDYSTMKPTNDTGSFTVEGQGIVLSPNGRGGMEKLELSCISYEEM